MVLIARPRGYADEQPPPQELLRHAGFIIWTLAGLPLLVQLIHTPTFLSEPRYWLWLACFVVFGGAFALTGWGATAARVGGSLFRCSFRLPRRSARRRQWRV